MSNNQCQITIEYPKFKHQKINHWDFEIELAFEIWNWSLQYPQEVL